MPSFIKVIFPSETVTIEGLSTDQTISLSSTSTLESLAVKIKLSAVQTESTLAVVEANSILEAFVFTTVNST